MKRLFLLFLLLLLLAGCGKNRDGRITVALVDTGFSAVLPGDRLLPGYNYILNSQDTGDRINHGTAVASILTGCDPAGVSPGAAHAYLVPLVIADKVEGELCQGDGDMLAQAIRDAVDKFDADIINLSLGVKTPTTALEQAVEYAEKQGVLVISAVGNDGAEGAVRYPAAYGTVLAVGSCDKNGQESSFSQPGADVLAQGEGMYLASREGAPYYTKGTSFATGIVTAKAACLLEEDPTRTPVQLRELLTTAGCLLME